MTRSNPKKHTTLYEEKYNEQNELYYEGYEVGRALGKGGFAHVYEIQQQGSPQVNAVKMISKLDKQGKQDPVYLEKVCLSDQDSFGDKDHADGLPGL